MMALRQRSRLAAPLFLGVMGGHACDAAPVVSATLSDVLSSQRSMQLQDTEDVVTGSPVVTVDPEGGFLVVDTQQGQIRKYAEDGSLEWHAGRKGEGPGEFAAPAAVVRTPRGEIIVADRPAKLTIYDSQGKTVLRTVATPLAGIDDLAVVDDSLILIAGYRQRAEGPRLHLWNSLGDSVVVSFFSPVEGSINRAAAVTAGWTKVSKRGDRIAAIFATSDTVFLFTATGEPTGALPLPSRHFRRVTAEGPSDPTDVAWLESFDLLADVHWLSDGSLVVPYQSLRTSRGMFQIQRDWHLVIMTARGRPRHEVRTIPQLFAVDSRRNTAYFAEPGGLEPQRWLVGELSR